MEKFRNKYRISSSRWQKWDYSSNAAYYVTICTQHHVCYFGDIVLVPEKTMQFTQIGSIAHQYWCEIPNHFPFVELDVFVIMPNHVHGIIVINKMDGGNTVETQNFASLQQSSKIKCDHETQNFASLHAFPKNYPNRFGPQSQNLASIIRGYKSGVKKYATLHHIDFAWQSRFHDHVIRNYKEYEAIRDYIFHNIENWKEDTPLDDDDL